MQKTVRLGTDKTPNGRVYSVFAKIKVENGKLSISGVEGPLPSGNAVGGCGQIEMHLHSAQIKPAPGWTPEMLDKFFAVWRRWHLNDMRAECEHQRQRGETWATHPSAICPDCGYSLGSAWLREDLPAEVVAFLESLPDADKMPAWV